MNIKDQLKQGKFPLPMIGSRILKTAIAVFICLLIHIAKGYRGGISESCITAIICMQPYAKDARKSAIGRIVGSTFGAFWGLAFLMLMFRLPGTAAHMLIVYFLMSLGVILAVYTCVVLNISDTAGLAAIVFLCVVINYPDVDPSLLGTFLRIFDTILGVLVALAVNSFRIPTRKRPDKLFFLELNHLAYDRYSRISSRVLIELNRLYDQGAKICLETMYAPAFLISQLQTLHINMPIIVLGGAALYDIRENIYLEVQAMPYEDADYLYQMVQLLGYGGVMFTLRGNSMMLFHVGEKSKQEEDNYQLMRRSPYRNYMEGKFSEEDQVLAFRMILEEEEGKIFESRLMGNLYIAEHFHVVKIPRPRHQGEVLFYFYRKGVTIESMQERLLSYEKQEEGELLKPVRIQPISARYNADRDAIILLHRIKHQYLQPLWIKNRKS